MKSSRSAFTARIMDSLIQAFEGEPGRLYTSQMTEFEGNKGHYVFATKSGVATPNLAYVHKNFVLPIITYVSYARGSSVWNRQLAEQNYENFVGSQFAFQKIKSRLKGLRTPASRIVPSGIPLPFGFPPAKSVAVITNFHLPLEDQKYWADRSIRIISALHLDELADIIPKSASINNSRLKAVLRKQATFLYKYIVT